MTKTKTPAEPTRERILYLKSQGFSYSEIGESFGLHKQTIYGIANGRTRTKKPEIEKRREALRAELKAGPKTIDQLSALPVYSKYGVYTLRLDLKAIGAKARMPQAALYYLGGRK